MKAQLVSEIRKLATTRTIYWFVVGAVGLMVMSVLSVSGQFGPETTRPLQEQQFFFLGTFVKLLIVVVGIRMMTDEYRFGTVVPTFTQSPRRTRVVAAKVIVGAGTGVAIAGIAMAALVGTALVSFAMNGATLEIGEAGVRAIVGGILAGGMWAVIGVGIGAIVRNQVAAIVGTFVWLMAIEEIIRPKLGDLGSYLPGQGGFMLALGQRPSWMWIGLATMLGYALVVSLGGILVSAHRDIS